MSDPEHEERVPSPAGRSGGEPTGSPADAPTGRLVVAGGCFWCVEAVLRRLRGVHAVTSGYAGGHVAHPTYEQVCTGATGHAEAVRIDHDPTVITADTILDVFFTLHDPTTPNRQGADVGTQYRSALFVPADLAHAREPRATFERAIARAQAWWADPIVTTIESIDRFWPAEAEHQDFFARHPDQMYCQLVIPPKVARVRARFGALMVD